MENPTQPTNTFLIHRNIQDGRITVLECELPRVEAIIASDQMLAFENRKGLRTERLEDFGILRIKNKD